MLVSGMKSPKKLCYHSGSMSRIKRDVDFMKNDTVCTRRRLYCYCDSVSSVKREHLEGGV